jgi:cytochrome c556
MKGRLFVVAATVFVLCTLFAVLVLTESVTIEASPQAAPATVTSLPASLDGLYPPKAQRPVLLLAMHGLNAALAGIAVDISENDRAGAMTNFESFEKQYRDTAHLVPEWESWYPTKPVEELGKIVAGGNPGEVMAAVGKVGAVCHHCHLATMVPAQLKYHWPDFGAISVQDPVTGAELDYAAFMQMLNASLVGVGMDLGQAQPENARAQLAALRSRMGTLRESCDACHDTPRAYFVDERVDSLLVDMDRALDAAATDPATVTTLTRRIGEESCHRCHLVHMPAAYSTPAPR